MTRELRTDFFFYVCVEWMLVSGSLLFYLVCLEKCVSLCVRGRGEQNAVLLHLALNVFTLLIML